MNFTDLECDQIVHSVVNELHRNYEVISFVLYGGLGLFMTLVLLGLVRYDCDRKHSGAVGALFSNISAMVFMYENELKQSTYRSITEKYELLNPCMATVPRPDATAGGILFTVLVFFASIQYIFFKTLAGDNNHAAPNNGNAEFEYTILAHDDGYCQDKCAICHDQPCDVDSDKPVVRIACGHVFHLDCISSWVHKSSRGDCPYCRKIVRHW